ncbi:YeaH/YhbH family protein [Mesoterricola sediminis]|uniref:UPF0229 protein METESE_30370 n=1 Tax=Mesoterricola sediminis TaxID=2927980 RepID=A0AA48KDA8_9BACT|nr:YeaH/YhbH family protein [Mesoterricola sediminis]BDU78079.1 UPF0229 protein [Mesoterricola sediminis]
MTSIIDRRGDSRNKSSVNRSRFLHRFRKEIRKAVADAVDAGGIRDVDEGRRIGIPVRDLAEPQFALGSAGVRERIHPGNETFATGDRVERPQGGQGGASGTQGSPDGTAVDPFTFQLTREEFLDVFFEELALPNLVKRQLASLEEPVWVRAGFTSTGVPANIAFVRTLRGAAGRRLAMGGPSAARIAALEAELAAALAQGGPEAPETRRLAAELEALLARRRQVPFLDTCDLRFNHRVRRTLPTTQAVMFCLMDVSGSMDQAKKNMAKRFFTLLYLFLKRNYERTDVVFIRHHTQAEEVDEQSFFHGRESGGTVVSTALRLMARIARERYASGLWNIYGAQASDGDNWQEDSSVCQDLMEKEILPLVQHFAYVEITEGRPQNLWQEYAEVHRTHPETFALRRVTQPSEIYPVFHELFRRRP